MLEIITIIVGAVSSGAVGLGVWAVKDAKKTRVDAVDSAMKTDELLREGLVMILRSQLLMIYNKAIENWEITTDERESFLKIHHLYVQLGGNGIASHLHQDIDKVRLVARRTR